MPRLNFHATCVVLPHCGDAGVLLTGPAGSGKSGLALRLIQQGAKLVSDDQTLLASGAQGLIATAPEGLRGLIEIAGYGIVQVPEAQVASSAVLRLNVTLMPPDHDIERLPDQDSQQLLATPLRHAMLRAHDPAAAAKIFAILSWPLLDYTHA